MNIFKSRKVQIAIADALFGLAALATTQFVRPEMAQFLLAVYGTLQIPIYAIIRGIADEDAAAIQAGTHPNHPHAHDASTE